MKLKEVDYQLLFYHKYKSVVQREIKTPIGIIDFIWTTPGSERIIEFKHYKSIKHAVGQLLSYRVYRPHINHLEVVYFDYSAFKNSKLSSIEKGFYEIAHQQQLHTNIKLTFSNILQYLTTEEISNYYYQHCYKEKNISDNNINNTNTATTILENFDYSLCNDTDNTERDLIGISNLMQTPDWMSI